MQQSVNPSKRQDCSGATEYYSNSRSYRIGQAAASLARVIDSSYCDGLANQLWKRRGAWVKKQASLLPSGSRVLDIGAGSVPYRDSFSHCEYLTQDYCQTPNLPYGTIDIISDIESIPLPDGSFDAILCTEVFEHIPQPVTAIKEIARLLKPGGRLIFSAPLGSGQHQMPYHYYGGYTRSWYEKFFPESGLEIDSLTPNGGLFAHTTEMLGRVRPSLVGGLRKKGLPGRIAAAFAEMAVINVPTVVLWEMEKRKIVEDFTVCFFCVAHKKAEVE